MEENGRKNDENMTISLPHIKTSVFLTLKGFTSYNILYLEINKHVLQFIQTAVTLKFKSFPKIP